MFKTRSTFSLLVLLFSFALPSCATAHRINDQRIEQYQSVYVEFKMPQSVYYNGN